jgi:hypothetical protein
MAAAVNVMQLNFSHFANKRKIIVKATVNHFSIHKLKVFLM